MDEEVDLAPELADLVEGRVDRGLAADVAIAGDHGADLGGQRLDALPERLTLIGEGDLAALGMNGLGDSPGDGTVVGNAHDDAALARHQSGHECPPELKIHCRL